MHSLSYYGPTSTNVLWEGIEILFKTASTSDELGYLLLTFNICETFYALARHLPNDFRKVV